MKKYAVIVAGGSGSRMGNALPKQFLPLAGKPLLYHTLTAFLRVWQDLQIVLALPADHFQTGLTIAGQADATGRIKTIAGGSTRFESVKACLEQVEEDAVVFVHDAVRCLISSALIERCYRETIAKGNAIPVIISSDSMRILEEGENRAIDRDRMRIVQTPQTFNGALLKMAYRQPYRSFFTDDASVVEYAGGKINLVEGEYRNIKITHPIDLLIAEELLKQDQKDNPASPQ
ncbi:MAG: 2-C-methyl-D-erythritol 4-phosphate cytidylyltransferase [Chitinophagaceae bacterium]|nr:2-C-methyl-D-erythritol 4-phosphate cytidylyltransferase [Chitinophagaceae bacterium]